MRRSSRLSFRTATAAAREVAGSFLREHEDLRKCTTAAGEVEFVHLGPGNSFPPDLGLEQFEKTFLKMCKDNMEGLYDAVWGWDDQEMLKQFHQAESHFFVAVREACVGFCQATSDPGVLNNWTDYFVGSRLEWYNGRAVFYVYELQVSKGHQRQGIGQHFMSLIETLARALGLQGLVLTCIRENHKARAFYSKHRFVTDASSPETDAKYEILSKSFTE